MLFEFEKMMSGHKQYESWLYLPLTLNGLCPPASASASPSPRTRTQYSTWLYRSSPGVIYANGDHVVQDDVEAAR